MSTFIFLCDLSTEQECLDRRLFGTNPGESHQHHYSKIVAGDCLLLYNFELGELRGPFVAQTACLFNIDPKAWKKSRRNFPWQVRVDDSAAHKTPINADELARLVPLATTKMGLIPPVQLSKEQSDKVLIALGAKNQP